MCAVEREAPPPTFLSNTLCIIDALDVLTQETVARHDAAGLVQGCWRRRRNARFLLQLAQETGKARVAPGKVCEAIPATGAFASAEPTTRATEAALSAPVSVPPVESQLRPDAIDTADSVVETEATKPAVGLTRTIEPREQRPQAAELDTSSLFELWSAFTSLLAAAGTRLAVRRAIASALLAPAAATMANISRVRRRAASSGAYPPSSPPSGLVVPPNPASFDCALSFERDVAVAGRRIAGMVRARGGLLSAAIAAGTKIIGGGAEEEEEGGGVQGVRSGEDEVEDLVLEAVQVRHAMRTVTWLHLIKICTHRQAHRILEQVHIYVSWNVSRADGMERS